MTSTEAKAGAVGIAAGDEPKSSASLDMAEKRLGLYSFGDLDTYGEDACEEMKADLRALLSAFKARGEALERLVQECLAEFMTDGMWCDTGQLVQWRTVEKARALSPTVKG